MRRHLGQLDDPDRLSQVREARTSSSTRGSPPRSSSAATPGRHRHKRGR